MRDDCVPASGKKDFKKLLATFAEPATFFVIKLCAFCVLYENLSKLSQLLSSKLP